MPGLTSRAEVAFAVDVDRREDHVLGAHVSVLRVIDRQVVAALGDGTVRFIGVGRQDTTSLSAHIGAILCGTLTSDGVALLTGGDDGKVSRVSRDGVETLADGNKWIDCVIAHSNGGFAFSAQNNVAIRWPNGRHREFKVKGPIGGMVRASPSSLAVSHLSGVTLFDVSGKRKPAYMLPWDGLHVAVTVSPDRRFVITGTYDNALHGWRVKNRANMHMSGYVTKPRSLSWSPRGNWLATSGANCAVLWPFEGRDGPMGQRATRVTPRQSLVTSVAWHPNFDILAIGYEDGAMVLSQRPDGRILSYREPDGSAITEMTFDKNGEIFACGTESGALTILTLRNAS